ncbi:hypothetical protein HH214_13215 [Mucilaginibacter robiniae]|uniref:FAD-binding domain-containing protein n=1 Tax=Mucilaginibacter robiniae TaxID=2728022 RepID=A0A7L5E056_9SPHI|nr:FAD-dependent monooxygenase [Mucilaginibacter robiniae]QJD96760.1 hypothetical protein HH214_13215 [Mucilaginibacter robiniae]
MKPALQGPAPVLIVGAGPSGLMMAAQLLRYGIQPIIIDNRPGPTQHSKALAVQARSLEIYRQLGIADAVIPNGKPAQGLHFNVGGKPKATFPLHDIGEGYTPYPFIHIYQQHKNERALVDYLTQNNCPVYWNTTLTTLQQGTGVVSATLKLAEEEYHLTCNWLIGADGAHSTVRKQLQIPFTGDTYTHQFYLADVVLDEVDDFVNLYLSSRGFTAFFPMPEAGAYRVLGNLPDQLAQKVDLALNDVLPRIQRITRKPLQVQQVNWFTTYRLHHRMADEFQQGRCFLIGDAAHIHSPVGGQGMNTGLQDAYNLAWKLAGVIRKQLPSTILSSYQAERMPIAEQLLKTTDRAFTLVMSRHWWARVFKRWILPLLLKRAWKSPKLRFTFFKQISQTGISYVHSPLSLHLSHLQDIKAGDRLPYFTIYDDKNQQETDLHAWCNTPGFTLITLGQVQEQPMLNLTQWLTQNYPDRLHYHHLSPSVKNQQAFNAFEISPGQAKAVIVRPDLYIGLLSDTLDVEILDNYLRNVVGLVSLKS